MSVALACTYACLTGVALAIAFMIIATLGAT